MANFKAYDVKVQAELSTGHIIVCKTNLIASGYYREWHESAPCEWMYGWTESEADIDEGTIEPMYADEYETETDMEEFPKIKKIIKVIDEPEWEVDEDWREDYLTA